MKDNNFIDAMSPNFSKKTIETLAKRAAYKCSNPDCRVPTVGPNSNIEKSTLIGEAAHIYGARANAKRYNKNMTNASRSEITNSIWLCRNCHKLIDTDEKKYSADILFAWREQHEGFILSELGNKTDQIILQEQSARLSIFKEYPPLIRRIVIDKPEGWEWRLTAELMRYLNQPLFRKIDDLQSGLYVKQYEHIDTQQIFNWVQKRLAELSRLTEPFVGLLNRLTESFGPPGEPGDAEEIFHITHLIRDHLQVIVQYEEQLYFTIVPDDFQKLFNLLKNLISSQAKKLAEIPIHLDEVVDLLNKNHGGTRENPYIAEKMIIFELPENWEKNFNREMKRIKDSYANDSNKNGCLIFFIIFILLSIIISFC